MKSTKHLLLALVSSLLFAAGLSRAAGHLDPLSRAASAGDPDVALRAAENCGTTICNVVDDVA